MNQIIEPSPTFDFSTLQLCFPVQRGGTYFTKIEHKMNNKHNSLYIQTPKSKSKEGIVKSGKHYYCDLMFDQTSADFISWIEQLEETCQAQIFSKKNEWFNEELEMSDIVDAFNATVKTYKSGKYYVLRGSVKKDSKTNNIDIKIYDENLELFPHEQLNSTKNIETILEFQGIKFTARSFQLEIEIKQIMVLEDDIQFDNCLIKINPKKNVEKNVKVKEDTKVEDVNVKEDTKVEAIEAKITEDVKVEAIEAKIKLKEDVKVKLKEDEKQLEEKNKVKGFLVEKPEENQLEEIVVEPQGTNKKPEEVANFKLKSPYQVNYDLYKKIRAKAKLAKKEALMHFLEAKNIKNKYMLETFSESDSDVDENEGGFEIDYLEHYD